MNKKILSMVILNGINKIDLNVIKQDLILLHYLIERRVSSY